MNRFEPTTETIKKPEAQENHESLQNVENPAELRQQMTSEAEKETSQFKQECADDLSRVEARAEKDGLTINNEDSEQLQGLENEADHAKAEVMDEIEKKDESEEKTKQTIQTGKDKMNELFLAGKQESDEYKALDSLLLTKEGNSIYWKPASEINLVDVEEIIAKIDNKDVRQKISNNEIDFKQEKITTENIERQDGDSGPSSMKERVIESPELLKTRDASRKFLAEERIKLAQEIREQRKLQSDRLRKLKSIVETGQEKIEGEQGDEQYGIILGMQSHEANLLTERITTESLMESEVQEEKENISDLIDSNEGLKSIKRKLEDHYAKADKINKERFDTLNRSLEHVIQRNNAFIVHKIAETEGVRHNENSNISNRATYEDDIDILLSLEPSISASSVTPGEKAELWPGASGFLLGGGQIGEVGMDDIGSHGDKIKKRGGKAASIEKIDEVVGRQSKWSRQAYKTHGEFGMNEVVVNNPEVFGFFQNADKDEDGRFYLLDLSIKNYSREAAKEKEDGSYKLQDSYFKVLQKEVDNYRKRFAVEAEGGIQLYIMTPDRNAYEALGVKDDGTVEVGKKLTPKEVATGRAGLPSGKRKEIGERLLQKNVFRKQETQEEAREIIGNL